MRSLARLYYNLSKIADLIAHRVFMMKFDTHFIIKLEYSFFTLKIE
jgi:hypothetical protein